MLEIQKQWSIRVRVCKQKICDYQEHQKINLIYFDISDRYVNHVKFNKFRSFAQQQIISLSKRRRKTRDIHFYNREINYVILYNNLNKKLPKL